MFREELFRIVSIMPPNAIIIDLETLEIERVVNPEWQLLIDKIVEKQTKFLKDTFPEFYP